MAVQPLRPAFPSGSSRRNMLFVQSAPSALDNLFPLSGTALSACLEISSFSQTFSSSLFLTVFRSAPAIVRICSSSRWISSCFLLDDLSVFRSRGITVPDFLLPVCGSLPGYGLIFSITNLVFLAARLRSLNWIADRCLSPVLPGFLPVLSLDLSPTSGSASLCLRYGFPDSRSLFSTLPGFSAAHESVPPTEYSPIPYP